MLYRQTQMVDPRPLAFHAQVPDSYLATTLPATRKVIPCYPFPSPLAEAISDSAWNRLADWPHSVSRRETDKCALSSVRVFTA